MILNIQIDTSKVEDVVLLEKFVAMINAAEVHSSPDPKAKKPKAEVPKAEVPKAEAPKAEAPKAEAPKAEAPKAEAPKAEAPKAEAPEETTSDVSLKDLQLLLQTKGDGNRALIKGKLIELGAKSMSTLAEGQYQVMYDFLKGLK